MHSGFLNVLKPPGMTSHDVVSFLRRVYGQKKIGHAGTLDPGAAGVLPVALGSATRLLEYIADAGKSYRAEVTLGYATDSGDEMGTIIAQCADFSPPDAAALEAALQSFAGEICQTPPMQSAIKVGGAKLYDLARRGICVDVPERVVQIDRIALLSRGERRFRFDVDCSKGTYIRTLCQDIGVKLGIPAVMSFLIRTRVGVFALAEAQLLEEIEACPQEALLPLDCALRHLPALHCTAAEVKAFIQGQRLALSSPEPGAPHLRVYDETGALLGIGRCEGGVCIRPLKVISR